MSFEITRGTLSAANGSSKCAYCSTLPKRMICEAPENSVLFDGEIPTLTGLSGHMWASQLLTLTSASNGIDIRFDFKPTNKTDENIIRMVQVVLFNCPFWQIGANFISVWNITGTANLISSITELSTCCNNLTVVCINMDTSRTASIINLKFAQVGMKLHLAEITFYKNSTCDYTKQNEAFSTWSGMSSILTEATHMINH